MAGHHWFEHSLNKEFSTRGKFHLKINRSMLVFLETFIKVTIRSLYLGCNVTIVLNMFNIMLLFKECTHAYSIIHTVFVY
jgi:hypothetical protein